MKKILQIAICLTILSECCACIGREGSEVENRVKVGDPIPTFTVAEADGDGAKEFSSDDFVGMHSIILLFRSSCADCKREMPKIHNAWMTLKDRPDFQIVAISRGESAQAVAKYWSSSGFADMPYFLDPNSVAFNKFANMSVPRIYLVGSDGKVKYMGIERFEFASGDELVDIINEKL